MAWRDRLRRLLPGGRCVHRTGLVDVVKAAVLGDATDVQRTAAEWKLRLRDEEERRLDAEQRRQAATWLEERVRAGGGCWMPGDE